MLAIRLRRTGAKKDAHYRVVVTDRTSSRDGRFLEILGHYHPRSQPAELNLDMERTDHWVALGAQMSDTVRSLYKMVQGGGVPAEKAAAAPVSEAPVEEAVEAAAEVEAAEDGAGEVEESAAEGDSDGGEEE
ncbi:MAG: 30S ribosomal protein S16 [Acidobacteria bacterium]|nr:30S ribosomal protein S16 [Acidobacteriota bacterium]